MKRAARILTFLVVFAAATLYGADEETMKVPVPAAQLVIPILDLAAWGQLHPGEEWKKGSPGWKKGVLLGKLFEDKSRRADEAIAILLRFYIGESTGADLEDEATNRGRRMLPLLRKYEDRHIIIPGRARVYDKLAKDSQMIKEVRDYILRDH